MNVYNGVMSMNNAIMSINNAVIWIRGGILKAELIGTKEDSIPFREGWNPVAARKAYGLTTSFPVTMSLPTIARTI